MVCSHNCWFFRGNGSWFNLGGGYEVRICVKGVHEENANGSGARIKSTASNCTFVITFVKASDSWWRLKIYGEWKIQSWEYMNAPSLLNNWILVVERRSKWDTIWSWFFSKITSLENVLDDYMYLMVAIGFSQPIFGRYWEVGQIHYRWKCWSRSFYWLQFAFASI